MLSVLSNHNFNLASDGTPWNRYCCLDTAAGTVTHAWPFRVKCTEHSLDRTVHIDKTRCIIDFLLPLSSLSRSFCRQEQESLVGRPSSSIITRLSRYTHSSTLTSIGYRYPHITRSHITRMHQGYSTHPRTNTLLSRPLCVHDYRVARERCGLSIWRSRPSQLRTRR